MNTKSFIISLLLPFVSFSQIGIGTSTVDASAKLQVDATNKGFLQPRVALTGTADTATIATPATGLMVFNTATAGSGATAVTPGVYYHNGTAWQRVANQTELAAATASTATFVNGNLGAPFNSLVSSGPYGSTYGAKNFGASIILPPGKWEVVLELTADIQLQFDMLPAIAWINYWLDSTTPSNSFSYFQVINGTTIGTSDAIFTGGASFVRQIGAVSNHTGKFYINNATQSNKTYTLYFFESAPYNDNYQNDCVRFNYSKFGGAAGWPGNRFYATKIN
jgi:hypothetical protein